MNRVASILQWPFSAFREQTRTPAYKPSARQACRRRRSTDDTNLTMHRPPRHIARPDCTAAALRPGLLLRRGLALASLVLAGLARAGLVLAALLIGQVAGAAQSSGELVAEAIRHEHAEGVPRDLAQAHALYCQAARLKDPDALLRLGWMYANGRGVDRDDAIAHRLFERAASAGSEVGARLTTMVRPAPGQSPRDPDCLRATSRRAAPTRAATIADPLRVDTALLEREAARHSAARRQIVGTVIEQARRHGIDPRLVLAVIRAESGFDPDARSPRNAQGLMQLIPETAERFAVSDAFDPEQNIRGGIRYLRWLLSYFRGDVMLALAAYNSGEGTVDRFGGVPPYAETTTYIERIFARYPHARHPFDAGLAKASPALATMPVGDAHSPRKATHEARNGTDTPRKATNSRPGGSGTPRVDPAVRKFLGASDTRLAQSDR